MSQTSHDDGELVAEIERSHSDTYRVRWCRYQGHDYLDVRLWTERSDGAEMVPTKKGVTVPPRLLDDMLQALEKAREVYQSAHGDGDA